MYRRQRTWHPRVSHPGSGKTIAELLKRQASWVWHALLVAIVVVNPGGAFAVEGPADEVLVYADSMRAAVANGVSPGAMQGGSLLLRMQDGYRVSTLLNTEVDMQINGLVARVSVRQ